MSEAKFTKRPWKIDESYLTMLAISNANGVSVAEVDSAGFYGGEYGDWEIFPTEEQMANAHLIAAAPEMYYLLQELCDVLGSNYSDDIDRIESLLAKARGEHE